MWKASRRTGCDAAKPRLSAPGLGVPLRRSCTRKVAYSAAAWLLMGVVYSIFQWLALSMMPSCCQGEMPEGGCAPDARTACTGSLETHVCAMALQAEGEKLSRRNGELEATARRLRGSLRETEAERDRLLGRSQGLEEQLLQEQDRYAAATQATAAQVCQAGSIRASGGHVRELYLHIASSTGGRCRHACSNCRGAQQLLGGQVVCCHGPYL